MTHRAHPNFGLINYFYCYWLTSRDRAGNFILLRFLEGKTKTKKQKWQVAYTFNIFRIWHYTFWNCKSIWLHLFSYFCNVILLFTFSNYLHSVIIFFLFFMNTFCSKFFFWWKTFCNKLNVEEGKLLITALTY